MAIEGKQNILFLYLIDSLMHTSKDHPKTTKEIEQDIKNYFRESFPDEILDDEKAIWSASAIGRAIQSLNRSGLYNIATSKNKKDGYYCEKFDFTAAEFAVIAMTLYRCTSLSVFETRNIIDKFLYRTDDLGQIHLDFLFKQFQRTTMRRKTGRFTLPIISDILLAIATRRKVEFNYYVHDISDSEKLVKIKDKDDKDKLFRVSPYFLAYDNDECYLIGHEDGMVNKKGELCLSNFKISLIAKLPKNEREEKENDDSDWGIIITDKSSVPINKMSEYYRYYMRATTPEFAAAAVKEKIIESGEMFRLKWESMLSRFSVDRYMRENVYMYHDTSEIIDIKLRFPESFIGQLLSRFNLNPRIIRANPTGTLTSNGEPCYNAIITVQENDGLYLWLMQVSNCVTVLEPNHVRSKLKHRLQAALDSIKCYEEGSKDEIGLEKISEHSNRVCRTGQMDDYFMLAYEERLEEYFSNKS